MRTIDIGNEFYRILRNRDNLQGDGKHTAVEFRNKFLSSLDNIDVWRSDSPEIILDFSNVEVLGPSFANEVFAYFTRYTTPENILKKIVLKEISRVKRSTIKIELESGYSR